jgi:hypothetical protein
MSCSPDPFHHGHVPPPLHLIYRGAGAAATAAAAAVTAAAGPRSRSRAGLGQRGGLKGGGQEGQREVGAEGAWIGGNEEA